MNMYKSPITIDGVKKTVVCINYKQEQQGTKEVTVDRLHHIHILDRSGSMSGEIRKLIENVKATVDMIPDNDLISVIWFSGPGQCKTLLKGLSKSSTSAADIKKMLDTIASTVGCTCFSEPLEETNRVIDELKAMCENYNVTLFTDGCPVVPWSDVEEEKRMMAQMAVMKDKVMALHTVGYGYYYNQDLLKKISAETMFGKQIHSSQIDEYKEIFSHNYEIVSDMVIDRVEVKAAGEVLYLSDKTSKLADNVIKLDFLAKKKNQFFLVLDDANGAFEINGDTYKINDITAAVQPATLNNFLYAYAYELYYKGLTDTALVIIATMIRDKHLADVLMNAFTVDERQAFMKELNRAVLNRKSGLRMKKGEAPDNYIPKEDAFCIMDLINILQSGDNYYEPVKNYNRIGLETSDSFNMFLYSSEKALASFEDMVFNQKELNLSIRTKYNGTVSLNPKEAKAVGLEPEIDAHVYRNQTIIKDGNLNVPKFNAYLDADTYNALSANQDMVDNQVMNHVGKETVNGTEFEVVEIDLTTLPVINRKYAKMSNDIGKVLATVSDVMALKAQQKVVNYYIDQFYNAAGTVKEAKFANLTDEQIALLQQYGLDKNFCYQGIDNKTAEKNENDFYISRVLELAMKGWSSIPKVTDVEAKVQNGKKLNDADTIMAGLINTLKTQNATGDKTALDAYKRTIKAQLNKATSELNMIRLAKVLTNSWWTGLETDEKGNFLFEDQGKTLVIKNDRVKKFF